jgi:hypothetical protein
MIRLRTTFATAKVTAIAMRIRIGPYAASSTEARVGERGGKDVMGAMIAGERG